MIATTGSVVHANCRPSAAARSPRSANTKCVLRGQRRDQSPCARSNALRTGTLSILRDSGFNTGATCGVYKIGGGSIVLSSHKDAVYAFRCRRGCILLGRYSCCCGSLVHTAIVMESQLFGNFPRRRSSPVIESPSGRRWDKYAVFVQSFMGGAPEGRQ